MTEPNSYRAMMTMFQLDREQPLFDINGRLYVGRVQSISHEGGKNLYVVKMIPAQGPIEFCACAD